MAAPERVHGPAWAVVRVTAAVLLSPVPLLLGAGSAAGVTVRALAVQIVIEPDHVEPGARVPLAQRRGHVMIDPVRKRPHPAGFAPG